MTPDQTTRRPPEKLPEWFPPWAAQLADLFQQQAKAFGFPVCVFRDLP